MRVDTLRRVPTTLSLLSVTLLAATAVGSAQVKPHKLPGTVMVAPSSVANPVDAGKKAHTNLMFVNPASATPLEAPPYSGYWYETPSSLGCIYHLATVLAGCNPNATTAVIAGGSKTIAIVDAYDDPEAAPDLAYFSAQFGIPFKTAQFEVVYADGFQPDIDFTGSWELEESLDVEYAHAMAPSAKIYLVEASDNSFTSLFTAVTVATNLVQCGKSDSTPGACTTVTGAGEVSMSWGGGEFTGENSYDTYFNQKNVVFFASTGDAPGVIYPAASPFVVSVGGTSIQRSLATGAYVNEINWSDAGSGTSALEAAPAYQTGKPAISALVAGKRGTPDVSAIANPYTGVWVYDTMPDDFSFADSGWWIVGGTSAASPIWAGIVNNAAATTGFAASSTAELTRLYANVSATNVITAANMKDINSGRCYFYMGYGAVAGWDLCTGIGSPVGKAGK
jgi:subtilase family serine protease